MTTHVEETTLRHVPVLDSEMAYRETGTGSPTVLFLHGNPTSSYIWRQILPRVGAVARCIAPDLIGFGASGKPEIEYRFRDHVRYLDAFVDALALRDLVLVAQDWGTALAFHFARRFPGRVRGLAFMEFIRPFASWDEFHQAPQARATFQKFRTPGEGEAMILDANVFVEKILPGSVVRPLLPEEMDAYRAPFPTPASRRPIWRFPNELPIAGEPADVFAAMSADQAALRESRYPKVLFCGDPGALVSLPFAEAFASELHNCRLVKLRSGRHYLQEDEPEAIAEGIVELLRATAMCRGFGG